MSSKHRNFRTLTTRKFEEGATITVDISGSQNIMESCFIVVRGEVDLSAAVANSAPGGIANIMERIELLVNGYDPAIGQVVNAQTRINLRGRYFAYNGSTAQDYTAEVYPRMNFLAPDIPTYPANSTIAADVEPNPGQMRDVSMGVTDKQKFIIVYEIPFYLSKGLQPRDFHLDMANLGFCNVRLTCGDIKDLSRDGDAAGTIDATISVITSELEYSELITASGSGEILLGYQAMRERVLTIDASNNDYLQDVQFAGNYLRQYFVGYDNNGNPSADILHKISLEVEGNNWWEIEADMLRFLNGRNLMHYNHRTNAEVDNSVLTNGGMVILDPARDESGVQLSQTRYLGTNTGQAVTRLEVKKPAGGNGELAIVGAECYVTPAIEAITRARKFMTPAVMNISDAQAAVLNERATRVQEAARAAGFTK